MRLAIAGPPKAPPSAASTESPGYSPSNAPKKNKRVQLVGFGTFDVRRRAARKGRNPQTGKAMRIKASRNVRFKVSKQIKATL